MILAFLPGAPPPPPVACVTSPHHAPIASQAQPGMPGRQRAILTLEEPSAACDRVMDIHAVPMPTHPFHKTLDHAHFDLILTGRRGAKKVVDKEWWRRTSSSSPPRTFCDILFVGGHEAIPPVRCAPPTPVLRPRFSILCRFCSITGPRMRLCRPLPLHARASDVARAEAKAVRDLELHAAAARAASRAHQRCRGRLERPRLGALPQRPTDGRLPGRVVCVGATPPSIGCDAPVGGLWRL